MNQIIKAFTGIFIVLFMMSAATGILGVFFQSIYAQNLHAAIIDELENSDYTYSVIEGAFATTEENGFLLELILYRKDNGVVPCYSAEDIPQDLEDVYMAEVILTYPVQIAFFALDNSQQLYGYAR